MKKLTLKGSIKEMLSREEMKKVTGGYDSTYDTDWYCSWLHYDIPYCAYVGWGNYAYAVNACEYRAGLPPVNTVVCVTTSEACFWCGLFS